MFNDTCSPWIMGNAVLVIFSPWVFIHRIWVDSLLLGGNQSQRACSWSIWAANVQYTKIAMNVEFYGIHDLRVFKYDLCKCWRFMANSGWGVPGARTNGEFKWLLSAPPLPQREGVGKRNVRDNKRDRVGYIELRVNTPSPNIRVTNLPHILNNRYLSIIFSVTHFPKIIVKIYASPK